MTMVSRIAEGVCDLEDLKSRKLWCQEVCVQVCKGADGGKEKMGEFARVEGGGLWRTEESRVALIGLLF